MRDEHLTIYRAAVVDRLRLIIRRARAWPDERADILVALNALEIDPANPSTANPLAGLYQALRVAAGGDASSVNLNREHCRLLTEAIIRMELGGR